jgi:hypothetical protein
MKYEVIKANAARIYAGALGDWGPNLIPRSSPLSKGTEASFAALLPFIMASQAERQALRDFAHAFAATAKPTDALAASANKGYFFDGVWSQLVLRAREEGLDLINRWDVRRVNKLIELFPEAVPTKYRNTQLVAYMADDEDSTWIVEPQSGQKKDRDND